MKQIITTALVEAYSLCPRKAFLLASRQLIAQLFPTGDRSAFVALDRQLIASFGVGRDSLW